MGVEPPEPPPSRHDFSQPPRLLGFRNRVIAGVVFGVAYLAAFSIRGKYLPGLVGAILGGLLLYLVLKEADARKQRRWEEQRGASPDPRP